MGQLNTILGWCLTLDSETFIIFIPRGTWSPYAPLNYFIISCLRQSRQSLSNFKKETLGKTVKPNLKRPSKRWPYRTYRQDKRLTWPKASTQALPVRCKPCRNTDKFTSLRRQIMEFCRALGHFFFRSPLPRSILQAPKLPQLAMSAWTFAARSNLSDLETQILLASPWKLPNGLRSEVTLPHLTCSNIFHTQKSSISSRVYRVRSRLLHFLEQTCNYQMQHLAKIHPITLQTFRIKAWRTSIYTNRLYTIFRRHIDRNHFCRSSENWGSWRHRFGPRQVSDFWCKNLKRAMHVQKGACRASWPSGQRQGAVQGVQKLCFASGIHWFCLRLAKFKFQKKTELCEGGGQGGTMI